MNYKCPRCGFECMSKKLLDMHMDREDKGLTELEEKKLLRKQRREALKKARAERFSNGS